MLSLEGCSELRGSGPGGHPSLACFAETLRANLLAEGGGADGRSSAAPSPAQLGHAAVALTSRVLA